MRNLVSSVKFSVHIGIFDLFEEGDTFTQEGSSLTLAYNEVIETPDTLFPVSGFKIFTSEEDSENEEFGNITVEPHGDGIWIKWFGVDKKYEITAIQTVMDIYRARYQPFFSTFMNFFLAAEFSDQKMFHLADGLGFRSTSRYTLAPGIMRFAIPIKEKKSF